MAEAADLEWQCGEIDRGGVVDRRQLIEDFLDHRLVLSDQPALGFALFAATENVEGGAAQPAEFCK